VAPPIYRGLSRADSNIIGASIEHIFYYITLSTHGDGLPMVPYRLRLKPHSNNTTINGLQRM